MSTEPRAWEPGDPVYRDQPEYLACGCGVRVLWRPDAPLRCPECDGPLAALAFDAHAILRADQLRSLERS